MNGDRVKSLLEAYSPLVWLQTTEELRAEVCLIEAAKALGRDLYLWRVSSGVQKGEEVLKEGVTELDVLGEIEKTRDAIWILEDYDKFLEDPVTLRLLKDAWHARRSESQDGKANCMVVVAIGPPPADIQHICVRARLPLPDDGLLKQVLAGTVDAKSVKNAKACVASARGLTMAEAEQAFATTVTSGGKVTPEAVHAERVEALRQGDVLSFVEVEETADDIGGLDELKTWIKKRASAFSAKARKYGLPEPRGATLLGPSGAGKSLCCKVASKILGLPLIRMDLGAVFGSLVGESEGRMREALSIVEAMAPVLLFIDEAEKGASGMRSSGVSDGGTTARVMGTLLTWMQEREPGVFMMLTANDISALPPELLRKGRVDEIFFVDLPTEEERKAIFRVHIQKRGRDPEKFDLNQLALATHGFSGAEIEEGVISGMYDAFDEGVEVEHKHVRQACADSVPLSTTMEEQITELRDWARGRARMATKVQCKATAGRVGRNVSSNN